MLQVRGWYPEELFPRDRPDTRAGAMTRMGLDEALAAGRCEPSALVFGHDWRFLAVDIHGVPIDRPFYEVRVMLPLSLYTHEWLDGVTEAAEAQMPTSVLARIVD